MNKSMSTVFVFINIQPTFIMFKDNSLVPLCDSNFCVNLRDCVCVGSHSLRTGVCVCVCTGRGEGREPRHFIHDFRFYTPFCSSFMILMYVWSVYNIHTYMQLYVIQPFIIFCSLSRIFL